MKKIILFALAAIVATSAMAQEQTRIMKIWKNGHIVEQKAFEMVDSITFAKSNDILAYIDDILQLTGRGTIVTCDTLLSNTTLSVGDVIRFIPVSDTLASFCDTIKGLQRGKKTYQSTAEMDTVNRLGFLVSTSVKEKLTGQRGGAIVAAENSPYFKAHKFFCDIHKFTKEEGGTHTPFFAGYKPMLNNGKTDILSEVTSLGTNSKNEVTDLLMPGDTCYNATIEIKQAYCGLVSFIGQKLHLREGGRTIAEVTVISME
ncbi:MAG: hypothetical protein K6A36_07485 [Paludibacteraceae bacterium]|nr:hypothetical protein [Paludibacteraceae bacterium]